jgi:branched-chain amino acid transport system substrate-binding protein
MEELDGQIAGQPIEIIERDSQGDPSTGLSRTKELVENERVDAVIGTVSSAVALSIIPYITNEGKVPYLPGFAATTAARENTDNCNEYTFYSWPSNRQHSIATADFVTNWLSSNTDIDTSSVYHVSLDYENGQSVVELLNQYYGQADITIEGRTMAPTDVSDWAPYVQEVSESSSQLITGWLPAGPQSSGFINAAEKAGLADNKEFCMVGDVTSLLSLNTAGQSADGYYGTHHYSKNWDADLNSRMVEWYNDNFDSPGVSMVTAAGYNILASVAKGISEAGSTDPGDVISTLEGMSWESPTGTLEYRESDHQARLNYFGYQVEDGERNSVAEYESVIGNEFCSI